MDRPIIAKAIRAMTVVKKRPGIPGRFYRNSEAVKPLFHWRRGGFHAVADAGLGDDELGMGRVFLDLLADLTDIDAQILRVLAMGGAPDFLEDLLVREHLAAVKQEIAEQLVFL